MKYIYISVIFLFIIYLHLSAEDIEIFRFIKGDDTTKIYRKDIIWMTQSEFKLTTDASIKLKQINPTGASFDMYYCNENFEWQRIWSLIEGYGTVATFRPSCVIMLKDSTFDERNDIYKYGGKNLFTTAKKFNIPTENPAIKKVYLDKELSFQEIEITNQYLLDAIRKYVLSDSVFINNKGETILFADLKSTLSKSDVKTLNVRLCRHTILSSKIGYYKYFFSEINGIPILFEETILPSWFTYLNSNKKILYKEYYLLDMDEWEIVREYTTPYHWRFEYYLDNKIIPLRHGYF